MNHFKVVVVVIHVITAGVSAQKIERQKHEIKIVCYLILIPVQYSS